ncbi:Ferredoxin-dependent glutamate synthase 2, chloroplastic, partial [Mucuna pruriens]
MALHSLSSVSHVLRLTEPFPSIHNAHVFLDFAPLRRKPKRRTRRLTEFPAPSPLRRHSSVKAVLHLDHSTDNRLQHSPASSSFDSKPQVANLEDIISERGACGVGFIANLENKASHEIVKDALNALSCMEHRGGCGADNDSGDGSGLMTAIPWDLFDNWANKQGIASFDKSHTGVGMIFLPKDAQLHNEAKKGNSILILNVEDL